MAGYIFGAGTGAATPEALAARRRWAQAMIHSGTERTPQDPWEGLALLARAISGSYSNFKADQEEAENRRAAGGRFDDLFQPKDMVVAAPYSPGGQTGYRALANTMPKPNEKGVQFKGRMLNDPDLNLTPAMADGFIGNFDVETGGFKHMQEIRPIVPGSRGGLGWAMWTGPRRVAMEAWAKRNGLDPGSDDASYGFWKHEMLNTPEGRRVLGALHGVDDPAKAAEIVSSEYLRPGIPHLDRRVSAARRYAGQSAGGAPPVSLAQAGGPSLGDMLQVYSDPWISPEQKSILQIYIDRELKKADPKTQLELKKPEAEVEGLARPAPELTKGVSLPTQLGTGAIPPGDQVAQDARARGWNASRIPGGPATTVDTGRDAAKSQPAGETERRDLVTQEVGRTLELMDSGILPDTGWGAMLAGLPGTDAKAISSLLDAIRAGINSAELNKMRKQSPTGIALGDVTQDELAYLQVIAGGLDQAQSADQLRDNLLRFWNSYQDVIHGQGRGSRRLEVSFDKYPLRPNQHIRTERNVAPRAGRAGSDRQRLPSRDLHDILP